MKRFFRDGRENRSNKTRVVFVVQGKPDNAGEYAKKEYSRNAICKRAYKKQQQTKTKVKTTQRSCTLKEKKL